MIVVPEERRALVHRVVEDGGLAGGEQVLGPAVVGGWRETAVQVHDRVAGQAGCVAVRLAAAPARETLPRDAPCVRPPPRPPVGKRGTGPPLLSPTRPFRLPPP